MPQNSQTIEELAKLLINKQPANKVSEETRATAALVLTMVGAGAFLAGSLIFPTLPQMIKPFLNEAYKREKESWKRFNIKFLKQTLKRLEKQKLVVIKQEGDETVVEITQAGRHKILKYSLDKLTIKKPLVWDNRWRLVTYDIPKERGIKRDLISSYLKSWGFYPLEQSVFLHAYPCEKEVSFLREYLGVGECVRIFAVSKIENDEPFKKFFNI